jgi:hypothetical protein
MFSPRTVTRPAHLNLEQQTAVIYHVLSYALCAKIETIRRHFVDVSQYDVYDPPRFEEGFPKIIRIPPAPFHQGLHHFPREETKKYDFTYCSIEAETAKVFVGFKQWVITTVFLEEFSLSAHFKEELDLNQDVIPFPPVDPDPQSKFRPQVVIHAISPYWSPSGNQKKLVREVVKRCFENNAKAGRLDILHLVADVRYDEGTHTDWKKLRKVFWEVALVKRDLPAPWDGLHLNRFDECGVGPLYVNSKGVSPLSGNPEQLLNKLMQSQEVGPREGGVQGLLQKAIALHHGDTPFSRATLVRVLAWAMALPEKEMDFLCKGVQIETCLCLAKRLVYGYPVELEITPLAMRACIIPLLKSSQTTVLDLSHCQVSKDALVDYFFYFNDLYVEEIVLSRPLTKKEECALYLQNDSILCRRPHYTYPLEHIRYRMQAKTPHPAFKAFIDGRKKEEFMPEMLLIPQEGPLCNFKVELPRRPSPLVRPY